MNSVRIIDISRGLHSGAPHWPGDTATEFSLSARIAEGSSCNVGRLALSVHNGTHVDAPFHFNDRGLTIDAVPLEAFVGPARVIDARGHTHLSPELLDAFTPATLAATPRLLFRTDAWLDRKTFPATWPPLDPALPTRLAELGVKLLGVDFPSVDHLTSKDLALHHALGAEGILILENLDLSHAAPGVYELCALPLKIRGADGSPVRAVLRAIDQGTS